MKRFIDYIAGSFLHHLDYELSRPDSLLDTIVVGNKTPREWTVPVREELLQLFPLLGSAQPHSRNIIEELCIRNKRNTYSDTTFEGLNVAFLEVIKDLMEQTQESRQRYQDVTISFMKLFDHKKFGLSSQSMLKNVVTRGEIFREIISDLYPEEKKQRKIWNFVYQQNLDHLLWIAGHLESIIEQSLDESEKLLHNILPQNVCVELNQNNKVTPVHIESGSVLFSDFVNFTGLTETMNPEQLIEELDICFTDFDQIIKRFGLEKIKTIGDGYMCAGGLMDDSDKKHPHYICLAALEMREAVRKLALKRKMSLKKYWHIRIGIHVGPIVAGIIGNHKFCYDIFGDTVNTASRMESSGMEDGINISKELNSIIEPFFQTEYRGTIPAKNKGTLPMYQLHRLRPGFCVDTEGIKPNENFHMSLNRL